jgi:hypothetical protein
MRPSSFTSAPGDHFVGDPGAPAPSVVRARGRVGKDPLLWMWLMTATLIGVAIRIPLTLNARPRYDEAYTYNDFITQPWWEALSGYHVPNNHVLHTLAARAFYVITGDGDLIAARVPALMAGITLIPLTAVLAYRMSASRRTAAITAFIVALWPQLIRFSTNARGYTMITVFGVTLAIISLDLAVSSERRISRWAAWAAVAAVGLFTVPVFLYTVIGLFVWISWLRIRRQGLSWSVAVSPASAVAVAGVLALLLYTPVVARNGIESLVANRFVEPLAFSSWSSGIGEYLINVGQWAIEGSPVIGASLAAILIAWGLVHHRTTPAVRILPASLLLAAGLLLAAQRVHPYERIWIQFLPFAAIVLATGISQGITSVRLRHPRIWTLTAIGGVVLLSLNLVAQTFDPDSALRSELNPDIERIAALIADEFPAGARVVVHRSDGPQFKYARSRSPDMVLDAGPKVLVHNHRRPATLDEMADLAAVTTDELSLVAKLPDASIYAVK